MHCSSSRSVMASRTRVQALLLRVSGGGDHGVEFLPKLGGLDRLAFVVGGHQRRCHGAKGGITVHLRCNGRREGDMPLVFERSESEKNLSSDYHVGEACRRILD
jgi:hypothetical protein